MKALALSVALLVATPVSANSYEFCDIMGDLALYVAEQRDEGVSRRAMRRHIFDRVDEDLQQDFLWVADSVYERPYLDPDDEAEFVFDECIKILGETI